MSVAIVDGALHGFNVTKFNFCTRRMSEAIVHRGRDAQNVLPRCRGDDCVQCHTHRECLAVVC